MLCKNCGNTVDDNLSYCDVCGGRMEVSKTSDEIINNQPVYEEPVTMVESETAQTVTNNAKIDKLIWHHIFCIGTLVMASSTIWSILSLFASGEITAALISIVPSAWTIFSVVVAIMLLMKKAAGIKLIKIRSWMQIVIGGLEIVCGIIVALFLETLIATENFMGIMAGVIVLAIVVALIFSAIVSIVVGIVNLKYYKKHKDLFVL
jgi:hypothetical protein